MERSPYAARGECAPANAWVAYERGTNGSDERDLADVAGTCHLRFGAIGPLPRRLGPPRVLPPRACCGRGQTRSRDSRFGGIATVGLADRRRARSSAPDSSPGGGPVRDRRAAPSLRGDGIRRPESGAAVEAPSPHG